LLIKETHFLLKVDKLGKTCDSCPEKHLNKNNIDTIFSHIKNMEDRLDMGAEKMRAIKRDTLVNRYIYVTLFIVGLIVEGFING
jgi:hypothetical protein